MCSDITVNVSNLGKCYQIYKKPHERLLQTLFRGKKKFYQDFWALRNISFHVGKGETVGIVGRNGSGKTTLLQLIAGTLLATEGKCEIKGRVSALLALGAGFNPDFTGEENVYLNASMLGFSKQEISQKYESICDFADIGDFIYQPVKKYSSGMYLRLAFAVAVHVEPDILIIDEALSVGDEAFQRKCYAKLENLKRQGMTLLFVSHSASTVVNLCDRALLMEKGALLASGEPKTIIAAYHKLLFSPPQKTKSVTQEIRENLNKATQNSNDKEGQSACNSVKSKAHYIEGLQPKSTIYYESKGVVISDPYITTPEGEKVNVLCKGGSYVYNYIVTFSQECYRVRFGMLFKTVTGIGIGGTASSTVQSPIETVTAGTKMHVKFSFICSLNPDVYFLNAGVKGVLNEQEVALHRIIDAAMFRVMPEDEQLAGGIVDFHIKSEVIPL